VSIFGQEALMCEVIQKRAFVLGPGTQCRRIRSQDVREEVRSEAILAHPREFRCVHLCTAPAESSDPPSPWDRQCDLLG
jgi:hypothetical protein